VGVAHGGACLPIFDTAIGRSASSGAIQAWMAVQCRRAREIDTRAGSFQVHPKRASSRFRSIAELAIEGIAALLQARP